nr:TOBE domain-containing protein [Pararhizobium capsulatum]
MGEVNLLPGHVLEVATDGVKIETATGTAALPLSRFTHGKPKAGDKVVICVRPEHIHLATQESSIRLGEAEVTGSAFFGTHFRCHLSPLAARDLSLIAHMPQSAPIAPGDRITLALDPAGLTVLPAA